MTRRRGGARIRSLELARHQGLRGADLLCQPNDAANARYRALDFNRATGSVKHFYSRLQHSRQELFLPI